MDRLNKIELSVTKLLQGIENTGQRSDAASHLYRVATACSRPIDEHIEGFVRIDDNFVYRGEIITV